VTVDEFRKLAGGLADVRGGMNLGVEEFRLKGVLLATLGSPDPGRAVLKLAPDDQAAFVAAAPRTFSPALGGAGARGATRVLLSEADPELTKRALQAAWRKARTDQGKAPAGVRPTRS
jgi:hypothetical protein